MGPTVAACSRDDLRRDEGSCGAGGNGCGNIAPDQRREDTGKKAMKLYRMQFVLREPSEDTENKYLAEIPDLPGCRAWGDTAAQALENLQSVATAFIESCRDRGDPLPPEVAATAEDVDRSRAVSEVMVAA